MPPADRHDTDALVVRAALDEPLDDDERALVEGDDHLRAEVASFREVVDLARSAPEEVAPSSTLDHLWAGIAAEAFGEQAATPDPAPPAMPPRPAQTHRADPVELTADLQPVGDAGVDAVEAQFVAADGTRELRLDLSGLPPPDGAFYEVWVLDPDEGRLVSLGPARPDGTYVLPEGASPDGWPVVDVSVEPHDGGPGHSGASVLRGPVRPVT